MASIGHFLELLEAVSRRDWKKIEQIGKLVADEERKKKHYSASHQVMEAVEVLSQSANDRIGTVSSPANMPLTSPPELLHSIDDITTVESPILNPTTTEVINQFLSEWRNEQKLKAKGLDPRRTVLLHGPPGCGKTHLAKYIARELKLRLFVVRFDSIISSFLGETGQNLKKIFDYLASNRCALLIDELDAIAKLRDDRNELGELKRIVISLLQNIDLSSNRSLLIAATNHPHTLDPAIWRRFEIVLDITFPNEKERFHLIERFVQQDVSADIKGVFTEVSSGWSGADIEKVCLNAQRRSLLNDETDTNESLLLSILESIRNFSNQSPESADAMVMKLALRLRDRSKKYSFNELERLTGIPKSTLHHKTKTQGVV